jgi:aldehyde:ferredoxin oxidoreductase
MRRWPTISLAEEVGLRRYYEKRGWTPDGKPSKEKLVELGLSDAAEALYG